MAAFYTAPTCSPTRAMLMTGIDSHRVGLGTMAELLAPAQRGRPGYEGFLLPSAATLAEHLHAAGYRTLMSGKWHLGHETGQRPASRGCVRSLDRKSTRLNSSHKCTYRRQSSSRNKHQHK